jgi:hypothetical protein
MHAIVCIPLGWMWLAEKRTIAHLPEVAVADSESHVGDYRRVQGRPASEPVYWAPRGAGRGGNNYAGAGILVDLDTRRAGAAVRGVDVGGRLPQRHAAHRQRRAARHRRAGASWSCCPTPSA